jgi:cytochrome c553
MKWTPTPAIMALQHLIMALLLAMSMLRAQAQTLLEAPALYQRAHASLCLSCHTPQSLESPSVDAFLNQLKAFQANPRKDQVMTQMARGLTPEQMLELAQYFSMPRGKRDE